jgi:hypothetical protein
VLPVWCCDTRVCPVAVVLVLCCVCQVIGSAAVLVLCCSLRDQGCERHAWGFNFIAFVGLLIGACALLMIQTLCCAGAALSGACLGTTAHPGAAPSVAVAVAASE